MAETVSTNAEEKRSLNFIEQKVEKDLAEGLDMLEETVSSIEQYDEDMGDHSMIIVEPSSIDERIVNQYAFFAIVPTDIEDIEGFLDKYTENTVRYRISKDLKWRIADTLDALNVSERIMYPGLDGLSAWIARHYYVRD